MEVLAVAVGAERVLAPVDRDLERGRVASRRRRSPRPGPRRASRLGSNAGRLAASGTRRLRERRRRRGASSSRRRARRAAPPASEASAEDAAQVATTAASTWASRTARRVKTIGESLQTLVQAAGMISGRSKLSRESARLRGRPGRNRTRRDLVADRAHLNVATERICPQTLAAGNRYPGIEHGQASDWIVPALPSRESIAREKISFRLRRARRQRPSSGQGGKCSFGVELEASARRNHADTRRKRLRREGRGVADLPPINGGAWIAGIQRPVLGIASSGGSSVTR